MAQARDSRGRFTSGGGGGGGSSSGGSGGHNRKFVIDELEAFANKVVIALTLHIVANLVAPPSEGGTPIDTGWASSNWVPNIGASLSDVVGSRDSVSSSAQQAGEAAMLSYKIALGPVFITNNVPYILALNDGHSKQAMSGFVERAIDKAVFQDLQGLAA